MKLLLTSNGLCNKTIVRALADLLGKPLEKSSIAFIPTAANVEVGDKNWVINDLTNCRKAGFEIVDIVDISALSKNQWQPRLDSADVLLFGGGNTFHLMNCIRTSGFDKLLPKYLKNKVYMGISAGSMVTGKRIILSESKKLYYPTISKEFKDDKGLSLVDFSVKVHFNSPSFPSMREGVLKEIAKNYKETVYAIDDESAIKVADGKIDVVTEGKYLKFN